MQHHLFFVDMKHFFACAISNFLFRHKIVFRATPNFGHCLEYHVMVIYFCSNKNIITCQRKIKFHFCVTQEKNFRFFCITNFLYSIFTFHISSMLIFFVVILEKKRLSIHLLLTCLIYRGSY